MSKTDELIGAWREMFLVAWAESEYGWIEGNGNPIRLADWQHATLGAWWERRELVTTLAISNVKKSGKTLLNAILLAWRWLALPSEHFAVGNDLDQSAGRQFAMIAKMVERNPYLARNVKADKKLLTFIPTGSTIAALPVDAAGNAGANHLTASHTEAWGIQHEAGIRSWEELTPPPGMVYGLPALRIADSYAGHEGESQTWHDLVDVGLSGERVSEEWPIYLSGGVLLFHMEGEEAQRRCFRGTPAQAARYYADQKTSLRAMTFKRLHENKRTASEEGFLQPEQFDSCVDTILTPITTNATHEVFIGLDLATKHDNAAVAGVYFDATRAQVVTAFHRVWKPRPGVPVNLSEVESYLLSLPKAFRYLACVVYDPFQAAFLAERLRASLWMKEYPQTIANLTHAASTLFSLFAHRRIAVYRDDELRRHVLAASAKATGTDEAGYRLAKSGSGKIDLAAALSFACVACWDMMAAGTSPEHIAREAEARAEAEQRANEQGRAFVAYLGQSEGAVTVRGVGRIRPGWRDWVDLQRARELVTVAPREWRIEQEEISS